MKNPPTLRRYWFPATHGRGVGVTAPDAGTAWFMARRGLSLLPPGAALTGRWIEDVDVELLDLGTVPRRDPNAEPGIWFPIGDLPPLELRVARTVAEACTDFVLVNDDGSARELTLEEGELLAAGFHPGDGARPYVKRHYDSRTPDGRLGGFLRRSELPAQVVVRRM